jgi:signal transduction histidine kinase
LIYGQTASYLDTPKYIRSSYTGEKTEFAQKVAELDSLNRCAAALNATLDAVSVLHTTAQLACDLVNADLCIVFQREGNYLFPRASVGELQYSSQPIQLNDQLLLEPLIVDAHRRDVPLVAVRQNLGLAEVRAMICMPLYAGNATIGKLTVIYLDPQYFSAQQIRMLEIFASHAGQAVHNAQLYERLSELTAAKERQLIASEMHDTMLQTLITLNINLQVALKHAHQKDWGQVEDLIRKARSLGKAAIVEGRQALINLKTGCATYEESLIDAIQPELTLFAEHSGIKPEFVVEGNESPCLPKNVKHHLRRLIGEALNNIKRHAQATEVLVSVKIEDKALRIQIQDNGVGFTPHIINQENSFGLNGMSERANFINAHLDVVSSPGQGTLISILVPLGAQS